MSEIIEETPVVEEVTAEPTVEPTPEVTPEVEVEKTISEMTPEVEPERPNMIPEGAFLKEKSGRKAAEKEVARLKALIEDGGSTKEVSNKIDAIAEKHDIDKDFLTELSSTIKAETKAELEAEINARSEGDNKLKQFEDAFNKGLQTALERGPEFKDIVNVGVIKQLALLPQNAKKTISQLLEETYGNAIPGKRTIETTTPGGGKDPEPLDYDRAQNDIAYFNEVMADPKKKAEYNENMLKKGF